MKNSEGKLLVLLFFVLTGFTSYPGSERRQKETPLLKSGYFEGNEPFWDFEIKENLFILRCDNKTEKDTLLLSKKQAHTETYAFKSKKVFGVIRRSNGACDLDITEEERPTHEIYFSYNGVTYIGCGKMAIR